MANETREPIFKASIDDDTDKFFNDLRRKLHRAGVEGEKSFNKLERKIKKVGKAAGTAGTSKTAGFAAIAGGAAAAGLIAANVLGKLIGQFLKLAKAGADAFARIIAEGGELNKVLETAEQTFSNVFSDPQLGKETVQFLTEVSKRLRINRVDAIEFARSILPRTESTEQFTQLLQLTQAQAISTGKTVSDLTFSIREALTGDFVSIQDLFDLPRSFKVKVREAAKEIGFAAALAQELNEELGKRGVTNLESFAATSAALNASLNNIFDDLKIAVSEPIFDAQRESLQQLVPLLEANQEQIVRILQLVGDVGAKILGVLTELGIQASELVDIDKIEELAGLLGDLFDAVVLFTDAVTGNVSDADDSVDSFIDTTIELVNTLIAAAREAAAMGAQIRNAAEAAFFLTRATHQLRKGDLFGGLESFEKFKESFSEASIKRNVEDQAAAFTRYNRVLEANQQRQIDRKAAAKDAAVVDSEGIDAALSAIQEANNKQESAQKALAKISKKLLKDQINDSIKESRRLLAAELELSRRREDIARETAKEISQIEQEANDARAQLFADSDSAVPQFEEDASKERAKLNKKFRDQDLDNEKAYRRELLDIQRDFEKSARDAALSNDAIAFVRATIDRDDAKQAAKQTKKDADEDTREDKGTEVEELEERLTEEREKIEEDLRERLRLIDEQEQEKKDALDLRLAEEEEAFQRSEQRKAEDRAIAESQKKEDTLRTLQEELDAATAQGDDLSKITAESLLAQADAWSETYGPNSKVSAVVDTFVANQKRKLQALKQEIQALASEANAIQAGGGGGGGSFGSGFGSGFGTGFGTQVFQVGQHGLVSELVGGSPVSVPTGRSTSNTTNNNTNNESTIQMDLTGLEPLVQRIAVRTALEVSRNQRATL